MDPLATRLKSWLERIHVCRFHLQRPQIPMGIIPRSCFVPIPEEAVFTLLLNIPVRVHSPTASYFERHPASPLCVWASIQFLMSTYVPLVDVGMILDVGRLSGVEQLFINHARLTVHRVDQ